MNNMWAIIFFVLPIIGCAYIGWHVWQILPLANVWKTVIIAVMLVCFLGMFANFIFGLDKVPLLLARVFYEISTSSIMVMLYLVMLFIMMDVLRLTHVIPTSFFHHSVAGSLTVIGIMCAVWGIGTWKYYHKVRVPITLESSKPMETPVKVVMISDLHLGYHNTRADLAKWVDMINKEQADLLLIGGDIVDISVHPLIEEDMAAEFRRLNIPVYACLGNHDYYAHEPKSKQFMDDARITLLRDSSVVFNNSLTIIGRDDRTNAHRKNLGALMKDVDKSHFTILLDHQPYNLEHAEKAGIDFQFSGHTHYGQVWPISWIEDAMYENAYGPLKKGNTQYFVSSGLGIWGAKFRIGTQSEYIVCTIK